LFSSLRRLVKNGEGNMVIQSKMRNDRSGVSALIAAVIIVIVVVASAAAFVVLPGGEDKEEGETIAPGTWRTYGVTVNGADRGEIELTFIGQNEKEYFVMAIMGEPPGIQYARQAKKPPKDVVTKGTEVLETFEGTKTLTIWEYAVGSHTARSYVDPSNGMSYRDEITLNNMMSSTGDKSIEVRTLIGYENVLQESYKGSRSIDVAFEYVFTSGSLSRHASIICVADCLDDQFGMLYNITSVFGREVCFISDGIHGLPSNATNTMETAILSNSIDGDVTVEIWRVFESGATFTFYCEPDTHMIYRFVVTAGGNDYGFDLVKKPDLWEE